MVFSKRKSELNKLLNSIELTCDCYEYIDLALTHSSFTHENKIPSLKSNERLEFLGDAVLKLIASEYLYDRFPEYSEGELTKIRAILISDKILTKLAHKIELEKYIKLGYHEEKTGGRKRASTLACAFEALLGALYIDGKIDDLRILLINLLADEVTMIDESVAKFNFKAMLQEYAQAQGLGLPEYLIIKESGPAHDKIFSIEVLIEGKLLGMGVGKTKKQAHQNAAKEALKELNITDENE